MPKHLTSAIFGDRFECSINKDGTWNIIDRDKYPRGFAPDDEWYATGLTIEEAFEMADKLAEENQ